MSKFQDLENKVAVVTGGAGILGQEFCLGLALAGTKVAMVDVKESYLKRAIESIKSKHPKAIIEPFACDVSYSKSVSETVSRIARHFGEINILHNNAATKGENIEQFFAPFEEYSLNVWREIMAVNLDGIFLMAQAVGKQMIEQGKGGSIIQTASIYGLCAPDQRIYEGSDYLGARINTPAVYSTSKAGVIGLTRYLATYWAKHKIRVNSLVPGGVMSGQNNIFQQKYSERVPLARMADKAELTPALLFLASEASSYITGQNIVVDGGMSCW